MTAIVERIRRHPAWETLTEAYEVRAFRDESEQPVSMEVVALPAAHQPDAGVIQAAKDRVLGTVNSACCPMTACSGITISATLKPNHRARGSIRRAWKNRHAGKWETVRLASIAHPHVTKPC